jgi:hypothetical protein
LVQIVVALIAALATIAAAAFQYAASVKAICAKREQEVSAKPAEPALAGVRPEPMPEIGLHPSKARTDMSARNRTYWYLLGGGATIAVAVFGVVNADMAAPISIFLIIPASSLLLALLRPIEVAYAAVYVTIATAACCAGCAISHVMNLPGRDYYSVRDIPPALGIFVLNVVVVALLDFWRWKRLLRKRLS